MDQNQDNCDKKFLINMLTLPTELLVYIISFLSSFRDRIKLRYVSRWLRCVIEETPSLWKEFMWPYYDSSEECCLLEVIKVCGKNIKVLCFPTRSVPSTLVEMLQHCGNVQHLSLPSTELDPEQLKNVIQHMKSLQSLEIEVDQSDIKQLFLNSGKLRALTIHSNHYKEVFKWWTELRLRPRRLNFVTAVDLTTIKHFLVDYISKLTNFPPGDIDSININIYNAYSCESPLLYSPELAILQTFILKHCQEIVSFVKLSEIGIQGRNNDILALLTDHQYGGRTTYKVTYYTESDNDTAITSTKIKHVTNLRSITHFEFSGYTLLQSSHLEQLAIACPNLQRLGLRSCFHCLETLEGLKAISSHCHDLEELALSGIHVSQVEDHILMWEILSNMKLTLLNVEVCVLTSKPDKKKMLMNIFKKCWGITGMSIVYSGHCHHFITNSGQDTSMLSYFPSLNYCYVQIYFRLPTIVQDMINNCRELRSIHFKWCDESLSLDETHNQNLQLLHIYLPCTDVPDNFMTSISAHNGLVHVFMVVKSLTVKGIAFLVRNSPKLITLHLLQKSDIDVDVEKFNTALKTLFRKRRLFTGGLYKYAKFSDDVS